MSQIVALAHQSGSLVGMTAGDANVVNRHYSDIWRVLSKGIDILFANRSEPFFLTSLASASLSENERQDKWVSFLLTLISI